MRRRAAGEKEVGNCVNMHVDALDGHNIPQQVWSPQIGALIVLIKLPGVEVSALTSVSPNFLQLTVCAAEVEGHNAHLFPAGAMPFPTYEDDFPDDALCHPHLFCLTTRRNAGLVLSDEGLPSRLEPKRRAHEEACCSRPVDALPGWSLFSTVEHLICLIAEPSTHCTVIVLLSNADRTDRMMVFYCWKAL
ncbi:hypothetical protein TcBrA4_0043500 [Trypanosoma cruzi]|nr:hypothetical protein TcBrA4_0043500 [Trypanosoma cruzi]